MQDVSHPRSPRAHTNREGAPSPGDGRRAPAHVSVAGVWASDAPGPRPAWHAFLIWLRWGPFGEEAKRRRTPAPTEGTGVSANAHPPGRRHLPEEGPELRGRAGGRAGSPPSLAGPEPGGAGLSGSAADAEGAGS